MNKVEIAIRDSHMVTSLCVTKAVGDYLTSYYQKNGYVTHMSYGRGGRNNGGSSNTYTVSYTFKSYKSGKCYISAGGATGFVANHDDKKKALLKNKKIPLLNLCQYINKIFPNQILSIDSMEQEKYQALLDEIGF